MQLNMERCLLRGDRDVDAAVRRQCSRDNTFYAHILELDYVLLHHSNLICGVYKAADAWSYHDLTGKLSKGVLDYNIGVAEHAAGRKGIPFLSSEQDLEWELCHRQRRYTHKPDYPIQ